MNNTVDDGIFVPLAMNVMKNGISETDLDCCELAGKVARAIEPLGYDLQFVPMVSGGVQLEAHKNGFDIEISIERAK